MYHLFSCQGRQLEYELTRKKIKNINLRLRNDGSIAVSAPFSTPQKRIDDFLLRMAPRILAAQDRLLQRNTQFISDPHSLFLRGQRVSVCCVAGRKNEAVLDGDTVHLTLRDPEDSAARERTLQALLRRVCQQWIEESSRRIYPVFQAAGVSKPEIRYRRMKRRWGSCCCSKSQLTFNTVLAQVPPACLDYVVMHEYCHFIHPNHSSAFHALMTERMPDWKKRKKILENYAALL